MATNNEKESINLESSCFAELGRTPITTGQVEENDVVAQQIPTKQKLTHRCDSTERELLKNHFPADV